MRTDRRSLILIAGLAAAALGAPAAADAQRLATDDPVLRAIWNEAVNNSQLERLGQALLDSIGPA